MDAVLIGLVFLYGLQVVFFYLGTHRLSYPRVRWQPHIAILVALRDEEATVAACIESLLALEYPQEKIEIWLINDRSRDATPRIIEAFAEESPRIRTLHLSHQIPGLSGKANAIAQGMERCNGEIILVTDGDCRVPKSWAKTHVSYYQQDVGMVGGFTLLDEKEDATPFFGKIQSLDWAYLLSVGTGAMGFGLPLSILGNNFSFRKTAYEQVGGYRGMGFTIIEDFALMKFFLKQTRWNVRYPIDRDMLVVSHPMPDFRRFYQQRKRWSAGGKEVGVYGKFLMLISYLAHIVLPLSCFLLEKATLPLIGMLALAVADFILLFRTTGLVHRRDLLSYFPVWESFYFGYTTLFAPVLLFPTTVNWKDVIYKWKLNWQLKNMFERR